MIIGSTGGLLNGEGNGIKLFYMSPHQSRNKTTTKEEEEDYGFGC